MIDATSAVMNALVNMSVNRYVIARTIINTDPTGGSRAWRRLWSIFSR